MRHALLRQWSAAGKGLKNWPRSLVRVRPSWSAHGHESPFLAVVRQGVITTDKPRFAATVASAGARLETASSKIPSPTCRLACRTFSAHVAQQKAALWRGF